MQKMHIGGATRPVIHYRLGALFALSARTRPVQPAVLKALRPAARVALPGPGPAWTAGVPHRRGAEAGARRNEADERIAELARAAKNLAKAPR